jgi:hypothetical protein
MSVFAMVSLFLISGCFTQAEILNADFELSMSSQYGSFSAPKDWNCLNYAAVRSSFEPPENPPNGHSEYWKIDSLDPVSGNSFVLLSSGDIPDNPRFQLSYASQMVEFKPGTKLSGYYFFGTCDYPYYYDYGAIKIIPEQGGDEVEVVKIDVGDIGQYSSMEGWEYFEYTFSDSNAGVYELRLEVSDDKDGIFNSYFAVDNLKVCPSEQAGNLNDDCMVNFLDFAILASRWLDDCNGISWCNDRPGLVDYDELYNMTENWLEGDYSQLCPSIEQGNFNDDCIVDFEDYAILCRNWLNDCNDVDWCLEGTVDYKYLDNLQSNWLKGIGW